MKCPASVIMLVAGEITLGLITVFFNIVNVMVCVCVCVCVVFFSAFCDSEKNKNSY